MEIVLQDRQLRSRQALSQPHQYGSVLLVYMACGLSLFGDLAATYFSLASCCYSRHERVGSSAVVVDSPGRNSFPCPPFQLISACSCSAKNIAVASSACYFVLVSHALLLGRMAFLAQMCMVHIREKSILSFVNVAGPVCIVGVAAFLANFVVLVVWILC